MASADWRACFALLPPLSVQVQARAKAVAVEINGSEVYVSRQVDSLAPSASLTTLGLVLKHYG